MSISYYDDVSRDISEAKIYYPFIHETILPTNIPREITLRVVVANAGIIKSTCAFEEDFCGDYSKEVCVRIPQNYKTEGCIIEGAKWLEPDKIPVVDRHFYAGDYCGYRFCLGVPESFVKLDNVLLENLKTVENMLIAYERLQKGLDNKLRLNAYAHGRAGIVEYRVDRKRYKGNK